jgi:uncharacterized protein YecT (DUF1311 family)
VIGRAALVSAAIMLAAVALAPLPAAADCDPNAAQAELNACTGAAFAAADRTLNALYARMRERLADDSATFGQLTVAQRAWIAWRDAECDLAAAGVAGGSVYPMIRGQCLTALTAARVADFHRYLACAEGDLSCPLPPQ